MVGIDHQISPNVIEIGKAILKKLYFFITSLALSLLFFTDRFPFYKLQQITVLRSYISSKTLKLILRIAIFMCFGATICRIFSNCKLCLLFLRAFKKSIIGSFEQYRFNCCNELSTDGHADFEKLPFITVPWQMFLFLFTSSLDT